MEYQNDYVLRLIEQMGSLIRLAFERFRTGESNGRAFELTNETIELAVDMDPELFVRLSPQSMVSFLDLGEYDERVVEKLAEALDLQAELFESEGSLIEAGVRRSQSAAVLASLDPSHAN